MKPVEPSTKKRPGPLRLKWMVQTGCFILFLALFASMHDPWRTWIPYRLFLDLDPLISLSALFGTRHAYVWALALLVVTMIWGRIFCGYACPLGFCIDLADRVLGKNGQKDRAVSPVRASRAQGDWGFQWILLGITILGLALKNSLALVLDPIALLTRSLAIVFYPVAVWSGNGLISGIRPLAERMGWYDLAYHAYVQPGFHAAIGVLLVFGVVLGLGFVARRHWCRSFCPLGALLGLLARGAPFRRRVGAACSDCGLCQVACPMGAIGEDPYLVRRSACTRCRTCQAVCPEDAISFSVRSKSSGYREGVRPEERLSRRRFFSGLGLGGLVLILGRVDPRVQKRTGRWLRPPGSIPESDFLAACVRCGACTRVCVTHTLQASGLETGLIRWGTPVHNMRLAGCEQQCNLCGRICPTGAIRNLPLIERQHAKVGTAVLFRERCIAWAQDRLCLVCDEACPYNAIVFHQIDGHRRPLVDESRCNGCGMCEAACPVEGEAAIIVYPLGEVRIKEGLYKEILKRRRIYLRPKHDRLEADDEQARLRPDFGEAYIDRGLQGRVR